MARGRSLAEQCGRLHARRWQVWGSSQLEWCCRQSTRGSRRAEVRRSLELTRSGAWLNFLCIDVVDLDAPLPGHHTIR